MATEKLKFRLELYATMWDRPPHVEIMINDQSMFKKDITGTLDKPDLVEFEYEMTEDQEYRLIINRSGKQGKSNLTNTDTDHGVVWPEQIESQTVADEDGKIIYDGVYTPRYPEPWVTRQRESGAKIPESFKNVTQLGHDGEWKLTFSSPFYMWLLENLY